MQATTQQTILATIAVLQFLAFVTAGLIAFHQARSHIGLRKLQSTLAILRYIEDKDISRARWFAYEHHKEVEAVLDQECESPFQTLAFIDKRIRELSKDQLDLYDYLRPVVALNIAGYMVDQKLVEQGIVSELLASTFVRTWEAYKRFIAFRRNQRFLSEGRHLPSKYGYYLEKIVKTIDKLSI